jgi:hypothetical protein
MKSIRIASSVKYIEQADPNVTLFRIQEILSEHRSTLIMRVLGDLPTYLQFKFYANVDKGVHGILRDKLSELANAKVNLDHYDDIVQDIKTSSSYRVPSHQFFQEIDALLDAQLNPRQLSIIK